MSGDELAQRITELLKPTVKDAAREEVGRHMGDIGGIVRKEMDECLDEKCDAIASKVAEKLTPGEAPPALKSEDIAKAVKGALGETVKEALGEVKPSVTVEGHTAHDILECPNCKPIVVEALWKDEEYRRQVMERVCEDDECRQAISKMFEGKGYEVRKRGEETREETWAERRLRERRESKPE